VTKKLHWRAASKPEANRRLWKTNNPTAVIKGSVPLVSREAIDLRLKYNPAQIRIVLILWTWWKVLAAFSQRHIKRFPKATPTKK